MKANRGKSHQTCQECIIDHRLRGEKGLSRHPVIPCELHGRPELWPENETAWGVWQLVANQVIILGTGDPKHPIIELNHAAVIPVIQMYAASREEQQPLFEKVVLCHRIAQSKGVVDFFK